MGYTGEEMIAANDIAAKVFWKLGLHADPGPIHWSRNGPFQVLFDIPFLGIGDICPNPHAWQNHLLALQPCLFTAAIVTLIFVWVRRLRGNAAWAFLIALLTGFTTLLWPYAYFGLETTQSFFLLLAGYIALECRPDLTWSRSILFGFVAAAAVASKSTGAFLVPAAAFLMYASYFRQFRARNIWKLTAVVCIVSSVFLVNAHFRSLFWAAGGGTRGFLAQFAVPDPIYFFSNFISFFGSPNKGLLFYCPSLLLALAALQVTFRTHRNLTIFAALILLSLAGGFSLLIDWSDETWGPRYLHASIAPLMVCLGVSRDRLAPRREIPLFGLSIIGLVMALLGLLVQYGFLVNAEIKESEDLLENFQGDVVWNHPRFNARLLVIWLKGNQPGERAMWVPAHHWFPVKPPGPNPWKPIDLAPYAQPQPELLHDWQLQKPTRILWLWRQFLASLVIGPMVLIYAAFRIRWESRRTVE